MILDVCCGGKLFYFDKGHPDLIDCDIRYERDLRFAPNGVLSVMPHIISDFSALPFKSEYFSLVIWDPPHLKKIGKTSFLFKKYGRLPSYWESLIRAGFDECWRVLRVRGTLIFKWNTEQVSLPAILKCFPIVPLLGHRTTKNLKTHWIVFYKGNSAENEQMKF